MAIMEHAYYGSFGYQVSIFFYLFHFSISFFLFRYHQIFELPQWDLQCNGLIAKLSWYISCPLWMPSTIRRLVLQLAQCLVYCIVQWIVRKYMVKWSIFRDFLCFLIATSGVWKFLTLSYATPEEARAYYEIIVCSLCLCLFSKVTSFFAASSRYGSPDELKALVDEAHRQI